jgi:hypothetical protein
MNCLKCDRALVNIIEDGNQPKGGSEFVTEGHYGSAVTDHMDGTLHVINVCDDCLTAAMARGACMVRVPSKRKSWGEWLNEPF